MSPSGTASASVVRWLSRLEIRDVVSLLLIWLSLSLVYWSSLSTGEFWWTDESRHAMDGVFFLDMGRDLPWRAPYEYALQYFGQYPALALNWYPPFFAWIEAIFFALFGISETTARLAIFSFALVSAVAWYALVKQTWGRVAAVLSFLLFFFMPGVLLWTRSVMLEVPAVAMVVLSVLAFDRYLRRPGIMQAAVAGVLLACTLLVKQSTVFILPALLAYALLSRRKQLLWRREAVLAYLIVGLALIILAIHAVKFGKVGLGATFGSLHENANAAYALFSVSRWTLYLEALWNVSNPLFLMLSVFGVIQLFQKKATSLDLLALSWLISWYLVSTLIFGSGLADRYTMYGLPALALLACRPLSNLVEVPRVARSVFFALIVGVVIWNLWKAWNEEHPYVSGYRQMAEYVLDKNDTGLILFAGKHDGNFIFNIRALDPERTSIVLRADKILVSLAVHKYFGTLSHVKTEDDILNLIDRYGIDVIVIESPDIVGLPEFTLLSDLLAGPKFSLLHEISVRSNLQNYSNLSLKAFRYLDRKAQSREQVVIPLPHMGIEIKLNRSDPPGKH